MMGVKTCDRCSNLAYCTKWWDIAERVNCKDFKWKRCCDCDWAIQDRRTGRLHCMREPVVVDVTERQHCCENFS